MKSGDTCPVTDINILRGGADYILLARRHSGGIPGGRAVCQLKVRHSGEVAAHGILPTATVAMGIDKTGVYSRAAKIQTARVGFANSYDFARIYRDIGERAVKLYVFYCFHSRPPCELTHFNEYIIHINAKIVNKLLIYSPEFATIISSVK